METNKTAQRIAKAQYIHYLRSNARKLSDVYGSYSQFKEEAMERCLKLMRDLNGRDLKIISHNSNYFTVGFMYTDEETGEVMFAYITKDHDRACGSPDL